MTETVIGNVIMNEDIGTTVDPARTDIGVGTVTENGRERDQRGMIDETGIGMDSGIGNASTPERGTTVMTDGGEGMITSLQLLNLWLHTVIVDRGMRRNLSQRL